MATPQGDLLDSDWHLKLRAVGLRATKQRRAVVEAVSRQPHSWFANCNYLGPRHAMNEKSTTIIITRCAVTVAGSKISTVEPSRHPACIPETHTDMTIEIAEVIYTAVCHEFTQAQATTDPHDEREDRRERQSND